MNQKNPAKAKTNNERYAASVYVVKLQRKEFDPKTGKQLFAPMNQTFTPHEWEQFQKEPQGFSVVEILQDPTVKADEEDKPVSRRKA
jgi:hypothetical protein